MTKNPDPMMNQMFNRDVNRAGAAATLGIGGSVKPAGKAPPFAAGKKMPPKKKKKRPGIMGGSPMGKKC